MSDPTITRGPATIVGLSSVYSAAAAYLTLLVAARTLAPADNATFLVYWALLFGAYGVVTGVSPEAARSSYDHPGSATGTASSSTTTGASVLGVALGFGVLVGSAIVLTAPLWGMQVLHQQSRLVVVVAAACVCYTGHLAIWGVVTGRRQWSAVAGLTIAEASVRLVLIGIALVLFDSLDGLAIAAALPALAWVAALLLPVYRAAARRRGDASRRLLLRNYGVACLASSASALLMVGFPVLISATSSEAELAASASLMLGISLTRAPLLVPLTALQGVALTHFLRHRDRGWFALWGVAGPVLALALVGSALAWTIGPWLFGILLGGSYVIGGSTLALLTISAGLLAILTLTGMLCLALHRHVLFAAGWITATAGAIVALTAPMPLTSRVLLSLLVGPVVGVAVHFLGLGLRRSQLSEDTTTRQ